jgi:hypothetical protein
VEYFAFFYNLAFCVVGLLGALIFTWWWVTVGKTSDIYAYMTVFMYGVVLNQGVSLYMRHLVHDEVPARELINSWWFIFRSTPMFLAVGAIVITMAIRTVTILRNSRVPHRKKGERRSVPPDLPHPDNNPFESGKPNGDPRNSEDGHVR